ncbi:CapA family protein [Streptomyces sp. GC420]|uniref:CapA family protein n=1 Tax=Streptomyces sp. GC420 TaxID=2697568 RepID=UPI001414E427|nr:CapA family protein [Streptomyces sp. GC420]NBM18060.1 CapA family protein [Streptomyces sp. GC420]
MAKFKWAPVVVAATLAGVAAACVHEPSKNGPGSGGSEPRPRPFTLVATGDVLPHDSVIQQAQRDASGAGYDFGPMLAGVKPVISRADLAICHMETVYGQVGGPYTGYPAFQSPPQVAEALAETGYDSCSTASNHTLDAGTAGISRTLAALDRVGVKHVGSARSAAEAVKPALMKAGGAEVAQLAYTYGTNGYPLPAGRPWAVNLIDERKIVSDARAARRAGADIVVVSMHWGTEWQSEPDQGQLSLAEKLTASRTGGRPDIDLIIGTHAHVPQAYQKVNGTWVVYGMGDQLAGRMVNHEGRFDARGNQSTIARFTFAPPSSKGGRWRVERAEFVPQLTELSPAIRVLNVAEAADRRTDLGPVRATIGSAALSRGAAQDGLTMGR